MSKCFKVLVSKNNGIIKDDVSLAEYTFTDFLEATKQYVIECSYSGSRTIILLDAENEEIIRQCSCIFGEDVCVAIK